MTTKELRELDVWIAEHVMEWNKVQSVHDLNSKGDFCVSGIECNCWIVDRLPNIKKFSPTTDPAAAMMVLEKCAEKAEQNQGVSIVALPTFFQVSLATSVDYEPDDYSLHSESPTLALAICLFAKELFK